jgi:uncharacterized damage-inducible protein DinB
MNPKLQQLFDQLEADRTQLLSQVEKITPEQFQQSVNGKWSIQQILAHLLVAEKLSMQYLFKKAKSIEEAENTGVVEELKMVALILSQRLPFKFKAPKGLNEVTPTLNLQQLTIQWRQDREELKTFLEKITDAQLKRKIYRHVRAGLLNVQQMLIFFREHYIHHLPQIKKLMR